MLQLFFYCNQMHVSVLLAAIQPQSMGTHQIRIHYVLYNQQSKLDKNKQTWYIKTG
jgi:hypothetical protein